MRLKPFLVLEMADPWRAISERDLLPRLPQPWTPISERELGLRVSLQETTPSAKTCLKNDPLKSERVEARSFSARERCPRCWNPFSARERFLEPRSVTMVLLNAVSMKP